MLGGYRPGPLGAATGKRGDLCSGVRLEHGYLDRSGKRGSGDGNTELSGFSHGKALLIMDMGPFAVQRSDISTVSMVASVFQFRDG
jgi:hypothetical protein